ncbi:MAG: TIGR02996 domain-containing protein [Myxococcaceae bacterium]
MPTIDTSELARRLLRGEAGARKEVERSFGVELPSHHFSILRRLAKEHGDEATGLGVVLSLLSRFAHSTDDLLYERHELRKALVHHLFVRWNDAGTTKVTIGIAKTWARSITEAWPELEPWSRTLEKNRERLSAWARKPSGAALTLNARPVEPVEGADDEAMLRRAIIADPDSDEPRLVYADWLMERGDVRGELIRLECGKSTSKARARIDEILTTNWTTLAGAATPYATQTSFDRGFVDRVTMTVAAFLKHGDALFSKEPIRSLRVDNPKFTDRDLDRLVTAPAMERVRGLELSQLNPDAMPRRPLAALAKGTRFTALRRLALDFCGESPADWTALFGALQAPKLTAVHFHYNHGSAELYRALATNPALSELRTIQEYRFRNLDGDAATSRTIEAFTALAQHRPSLKHLETSQHANVTDAAVTPFFDEQSAVRLEHLSITGAPLSDVTARAIAASPKSKSLRVLHTHNANIGIEGLEALLGSEHLRDLERLAVGNYDQHRWPDAHVARLAELLLALPASWRLREVTLPRSASLPTKLARALDSRFTVSL